MSANRDKLSKGYWMNVGQGAGVAAIVLLLYTYYAYTWRNLFNFQAAMDTCAKPFCDLASFYYPMGEAIFRTRLPLAGFVYSPFIAILLAVFPLFGLDTSLILWGILQFASIILYVLLFRRLVPSGQCTRLLFVFLALSSFPLLHTLTWGQVGIFTVVAVLGALFFYERGHRLAAAVLLALGLSFKFFPLIFIVPFAIRRDTRFLLITAATCGLFLFVVPGIVLGVDSMLRFYSALLASYRHLDWVIANYNSQFFPHVMLRLAEAVGYDARAFLPMLRWIAYSIAAVNAGLVFLVQRARLRHANLWSFHILFLSIPFILQTSWPADLVYLPFGQALTVWQLLDREEAVPEAVITHRRSPRAKATAGLLLFVSVIISNILFFNLLGDHIGYGFLGFIFWANLLLLAALYVEFLPTALRQVRIAVAIVASNVIAFLVLLVGKNKTRNRLTPLAGLAFGFVLAGLFFGENRLIGYGLMGAGVPIAVIDIVNKSRKGVCHVNKIFSRSESEKLSAIHPAIRQCG